MSPTAILAGTALLLFSIPAFAQEATPAAAPTHGLPLLNGTCPGDLDIHVDAGGPVYVNGKEAKLKRFNDDYFEARDAASGTTVSLTRNPDGTFSISYTGKKGANGACQRRQ